MPSYRYKNRLAVIVNYCPVDNASVSLHGMINGTAELTFRLRVPLLVRILLLGVTAGPDLRRIDTNGVGNNAFCFWIGA